VSLLGEHLDYNGGFALPCALSMGTYLLIRRTKDGLLKLSSRNMPSTLKIPIDEIGKKVRNEWWNYPLGIFHEFQKRISVRNGFEMLFAGDLPISAGLSSSASIQVVTAFALNELLLTKYSLKEIALLSEHSENNFVGVQCGILDPYAAAFGKENNAMFLNCVTAEHDYIPVNISGYEFIIANTNKPRQLVDSAFNDRFDECRRALGIMQRLLRVNFLADATPEKFSSVGDLFPDEIAFKRAYHIVYENDRVKKASVALLNGDIKTLAELMNISHTSLRDFYEVSCFELEIMVQAAISVEGCLASRLTGAGFGGCTISLIRKDIREKFCGKVFSEYKMKTSLDAEFYEVKVGDRAREIYKNEHEGEG
jgi:galactokinase